MTRRCAHPLCALALLAALCSAAAARADRAPPAASAIDQVIETFSEACGDLISPQDPVTLAIVFRARGPEDAPAAGGALGRVVQSALPAALRAQAPIAHILELGPGEREARQREAAAGGASYLLEITLHLVGTSLLLTGDLSPTWENLWTGEIAGSSRTFTVQTRADRAARLLSRATTAAAPSASRLRLVPIGEIPGEIVAVAVGDARGDGVQLLATLTLESVIVHRLEEGRLREIARYELEAQGRALVRARAPTGGIAIARVALSPAIIFRHERHAAGAILHLKGRRLEYVAEANAVPLAAAGGLLVFGDLVVGRSHYEGQLRINGPGLASSVEVGGPLLAAALSPAADELLILRPDYHLDRFAIEHTRDAVTLRPRPLQVESAGLGLRIADLDGDGAPERVASMAAPPGLEDQIQIAEFEGAVREWRPVPGAVRCAATGDLDADGKDDVVIASVLANTSFLYLLTGGS